MTKQLPFTLAFLLLISGNLGMAADSYLLPPDEKVANTSQEDWSRAWWQWAGSFENSISPVADQTGEHCARKQSGDVWFLAGTYETKRTIRTCTVPKGKYLFFPLINYVVMPRGNRPTSCFAVTSSAARMTEQVSSLLLEIDGKRHGDLAVHRQATRSCFDMGVSAEPPIPIYPSAANGYYVMLRPLPPGKHTLNFGGALPGMLQGVTYTHLVE
jgi:hypothetical protein